MSDGPRGSGSTAAEGRSGALGAAFPVPVLLTLAAMSALSPVATDVYLPAFTTMAEDLGVGAAQVQLTLTTFMIGAAVGQLAAGVLSDRLGRRPLLVGGLVLSVLAGVVTVVATQLWVLLAARFVQGLGGAAGLVLSRAVVADRARGLVAARALNLVMAIQGVAPIVAPVLGAVLAGPIGWRGIFAVVVAFTAVLLGMVLVWIPESMPPERRSGGGGRALVAGAGALLRDGRFVRLLTLNALAMGLLMAWVSAAPFLVQVVLDLGTTGYTVVFAGCATVMVLCMSASGALAERVAPHVQARLALAAILVVDVGLALVSSTLLRTPVGTVAPVVLAIVLLLAHVACLGLALGNLSALGLAAAGDRAGTGSALLGFLQFLVGGLVSPLVGLSGQGSALAFGVVVLIGAVLANLVAGRRLPPLPTGGAAGAGA